MSESFHGAATANVRVGKLISHSTRDGLPKPWAHADGSARAGIHRTLEIKEQQRRVEEPRVNKFPEWEYIMTA